MTDRKQDIRNFIVNTFLFGQAGDLTDSTSFLQQGILDSTGVLELATHLELTYGIKVKDDELVPENLDSIDAILKYLEMKVPQPPPPA
jgi:acyl carrier protein